MKGLQEFFVFLLATALLQNLVLTTGFGSSVMLRIVRRPADIWLFGGFLTAFLPAALSGFTTSNGPLYACLAMAVSFLLCFVVSHIARKCGWTSGQNDDSFYQLKVEENE